MRQVIEIPALSKATALREISSVLTDKPWMAGWPYGIREYILPALQIFFGGTKDGNSWNTFEWQTAARLKEL